MAMYGIPPFFTWFFFTKMTQNGLKRILITTLKSVKFFGQSVCLSVLEVVSVEETLDASVDISRRRYSGSEGQCCHLLRQRSPRIDVFRLTWNVTMVLTMPTLLPTIQGQVSREKTGPEAGTLALLTVWPSRWSSNQNWFSLIFRHNIWSKQR